MKRSSKLLAAVLCGGLTIGCGDAPEGQATTAQPTTATPTANPTTPASTTAASAATDTVAAAESQSTPVADLDPILVGLVEDFEDLPTEFAALKTAYDAAPTNAEAARDYIGTIEDLGIMHFQKGNKQQADDAFTRASTLLTKALNANVELDAGTMPAVVYYNHACVLGRKADGKGALGLLNLSVENGFANLAQIEQDTDLDCIRILPEYDSQLNAWKTHFAELEKKRKEAVVQYANEQLEKGETFPFDFDLVDTNGKPLRMADLKGRVAIVDIWGTWCPPCRQEVPSFVKLQDQYGKYGLQIVGLNSERGPSEEANLRTVKEFMTNASMNYPCGMISQEVLDQLPELKGFPTTLFIDHTGKVRLTTVGLHEYEFMEQVVRNLLTEQSRAKQANTN